MSGWTSTDQFSTGEYLGNVGIDDEPVAGSSNLVQSGGVYDSFLNIDYDLGKEKTYIYDDRNYSNMVLIAATGYPTASVAGYNGIIIPLIPGESYVIHNVSYSTATFSSYPVIGESSNVLRINFTSRNVVFTAGENERYLLVSIRLTESTTVSITRKETGIYKRVADTEEDTENLYLRCFPITNSNSDTLHRWIIDAYIPNYDSEYLYYIDIFVWKHQTLGTRVRIQKENKTDHTVETLVYDSNVATTDEDVQILNIESRGTVFAQLVVNTTFLDGYNSSSLRLEFSDNVGVKNGLYLSYKENNLLANSAYVLGQQASEAAQLVNDNNDKTDNPSLLRKSINLFDGKLVNYACDSTTGVPVSVGFYRMTKNPIPVSAGQTLRFTMASSTSSTGRTYCGGYYQEYSDIEGTTPILRDTRLSGNTYACTDNNVKSIRTSFRIDSTPPIDPSTMDYMVNVEDVYAEMYKKKDGDTYPAYVPYGYLNEIDASKNTLLGSLTGKNVVSIGDSITQYGFYPQLAGMICGANVKNCGVGGTWLTHRVGQGYDLNTAYGKFSGDALADSIATGDFSAQEEAANYIYQQASIDIRYVAATLSAVNWDDVDIITISLGCNDYNNSSHLEGTADSMDSETYRGAINYIVNKINMVYPHIRIIFLCPMYRVYPYGHGHSMTQEEYQNSTYQTLGFEDSDTWENAAGYTLKDIVKMIEEQAAINHCGYLNMYYNFGNNKYTYLHWLSDGTHLTYDGYREFGSRLAKFLMSD